MVIIAGHIDLSVGSVVAFIGAMAGVMISQWHIPWPLAVLLCLIIGALVGAWQGFWIAYFGIPAFIVTLAGMLVFRGAAQIALGNQQISFFPIEFRAIGSGFLPAFGSTGYEPLTLIIGVRRQPRHRRRAPSRQRMVRRKYNLEDEPIWWFVVKLAFLVGLVLTVAFLLASYNGTPIVLVILGALVVGYTIVMQRSVFGRHIYAIGGNLNAAAAVGHQDQARDLPALRQHGRASPRSRASCSPPGSTSPARAPAPASSWTPSRRSSSAARRSPAASERSRAPSSVV